ncbi:MAG: nucleotidyltransferase domain-containing protein [Bacteroidales bacterium]
MFLPIEHLSNLLQARFPELTFVLLFGSSQDGEISEGADVDLGIWCEKGVNKTDLIMRLMTAMEKGFPEITFDLSVLNEAGPVLRFEALKGRVLFIREGREEVYSNFYSRTCADYTDYDFWMTKQLEYRGYEVRHNR